jgi:hypothetical protein
MPGSTGSDIRVIMGTVAASTENAAIVEETGQSKRKWVPRKHVLNTLNGCLCGEVVDSLKMPSNAIIKCKELGCETEWVVDLSLLYLWLISLTLLYSVTSVVLSWR